MRPYIFYHLLERAGNQLSHLQPPPPLQDAAIMLHHAFIAPRDDPCNYLTHLCNFATPSRARRSPPATPPSAFSRMPLAPFATHSLLHSSPQHLRRPFPGSFHHSGFQDTFAAIFTGCFKTLPLPSLSTRKLQIKFHIPLSKVIFSLPVSITRATFPFPNKRSNRSINLYKEGGFFSGLSVFLSLDGEVLMRATM